MIDVGTSHRHGGELLGAIRRVTDKPVVLALVTHVRQEYLFGAAAFRDRGIPIRMQRSAADLMAARCANCLKTLRRLLGEDEMRDTVMFKPDQVFDDSHTLDVEEFQEAQDEIERRNAWDLEKTLDVAMDALRVSTVVPGHGRATSSGLITTTRRYLDALEARVRQLVMDGAALSEVPDASSLDEFKEWDQYDTIHRRNASVLFVRVEREVNFK